jgi:hypothetical protein
MRSDVLAPRVESAVVFAGPEDACQICGAKRDTPHCPFCNSQDFMYTEPPDKAIRNKHLKYWREIQ